VAAAKLAAASGIPTLLAATGSVADALAGVHLGTWFEGARQ
jgi:glutamate 5-kinase